MIMKSYGKSAVKLRKKIKNFDCSCFHLQAQKNHLYNLETLTDHLWELPKVFRHLTETHNISDPSQYIN